MNYIIKFQKENNLYPDGIIGRRTLTKMVEVFGIRNKSSLAHFLGQIAEETGNFKYGVENLNYSAKRLQQVFKSYFPTRKRALEYARNPIKIANYVYADKYRLDPLGNTSPGDGWNYRGRGAIQITGKTNYKKFSDYIGDCNIMNNPDIVSEKYYWETALWYFEANNIWKHTKSISVDAVTIVTKKVNGGYNGLQHRINLTFHFYDLLQYLIIDD
jgi:putative chitinase